jgi:hypothetical protein
MSEARNYTASAAKTKYPQHRFLGDVYVQGIMDGEAYDETKLQGIALI